MAFRDQILTDYTVFDGLESIRYRPTNRDGVPAGQPSGLIGETETVTYALKRAVRTSEKSPTYGAYVGAAVNWHIPKTLLEAKPHPGDTIIEDDFNDAEWTVQSVNENTLSTVWQLPCLNLAIVYDLRDEIAIETCQVAKDESGGIIKMWSVRYPSLYARMQPTNEELVDQRLVHGVQVTYNCLLPRQVSVKNAVGFDRIRFNGALYEIVGYRNAERVDELPSATVQLVP